MESNEKKCEEYSEIMQRKNITWLHDGHSSEILWDSKQNQSKQED